MAKRHEEEVKSVMQEDLETGEKRLVAELGPLDPRLEEFYYQIPLPDGYEVKAKVWRPKAASTKPRPLILFFHGGGFGAGTCEQGTRPGRDFALEFDAVVVSSGYRLWPQYKFPQAHVDGLDVVRWLDSNAEKAFGADLNAGFVVAGHSAGGSIAAVAASESRTVDLVHPITGSFICIAPFFVEATVPKKYTDLWTSREEYPDGLVGKRAFEEILTGMAGDPTSPLFNPAQHSLGLAGLPPTYVQVGGQDSIRDDCVIYERLLRDAGVSTKFDTYPELGHETYSIWTLEDAPTSEELRNNTMAAMKWLLKK